MPFAVGALFGQDAALIRLAREAERVKTSPESFSRWAHRYRDSAAFGVARMDRIAPPEEQERLGVEFSSPEGSMKPELSPAGIGKHIG